MMDEYNRLKSLHSYQILDTAPEPDFDQLTWLAAHIFSAPISVLTLVDDHRQWFKSIYGLTVRETDRAVAFCAHAIESKYPFVVEDASKDPRFEQNPLVTGDPKIRFYLGIPLFSLEGYALGTLAVIDTVPRVPDEQKVQALSMLAQQAMHNLNARRERLISEKIAHDRIKDIIYSAATGIAVSTLGGDYLFFNPYYSDLFGYTAEEMAATTLVDIVHKDDFPAMSEKLKELYKNIINRFTLECRCITKNKEIIWVRAQISLLQNKVGASIAFVGVVDDITERKSIEKKLFESERRFKLIARATADTIWDWDLEADTLWWSEGLTTLFGYDPSELVGGRQSWASLIHPDDINHVNSINSDANNNWAAEYRFRRKDGSYVHVADRGFIIRDSSGRATRMVGGITDVSASKRLEQELQKFAEIKHAQQVAELANQAKSNFLATMSHEIRTPISGVIGMVDVLHQTSLKGYQTEMVDIIRDSANSLLSIIDDILDFSKIESGKLELEEISFSLEKNADKVFYLLDRMAMDKGVELSHFYSSELPDEVIGDELRLRQILINLLNNAIKFSSKCNRPGKVRLNTKVHIAEKDRVIVEFEVIDNGIGMSEETIRRLFTPFVQADASTTRHFGGTGLGLSITLHLVELMGGEIQVSSSLDMGSVFRVRIPFLANRAAASEITKNKDWHQVICTVVGESVGMVGIWNEYLTSLGASVSLLYELEDINFELFPQQEQLTYLLLIDDPGEMNNASANYWQLQHLMRVNKCLHCLVIGRGHRREVRIDEMGIVYIDGNSMGRQRFINTVNVALGRAQIIKPLERGYHEADFEPPVREVAIAQGRLLLLAEDNETNQKVISRQLALLGYAVDVVGNGAQAYELLQQQHYALLITDIHMPIMDGYTLIEKVRADEKNDKSNNNIPIIALSANALREEVERCKRLGGNEYLVKPALLQELKNILERYLPCVPKGIVRELTVIQSNHQNPHLNIETLKELIGGDDAVVVEFLREYQQGAEVIYGDIITSFAHNDVYKLSASVHKLKSSSRAIGAFYMGAVCEKIEVACRKKQLQELESFRDEFEKAYLIVNDLIDKVVLIKGADI